MRIYIVYLSIIVLFLVACTGGNFTEKKELHKKFQKIIEYDNLSYGVSSSYKSGVSYKFITINFDVSSRFTDSKEEQKLLAKKLAKTAVVHYEPKKEYDGLVIKFEEEEEEKDTETVWKSSYKFLFEEL